MLAQRALFTQIRSTGWNAASLRVIHQGLIAIFMVDHSQPNGSRSSRPERRLSALVLTAGWHCAKSALVLEAVSRNARPMADEGRRGQMLRILRQSHAALDDDQIAEAVRMNRVYVNIIGASLQPMG